MEAIDNQNPSGIMQPKRPQFLTVLCVLSFIMCAFWVISGIIGIATNSPEHMQENVDRMREMNPEMADAMEQQMIAMQESTYAQISPYLNLLYTLISFIGVLMMWKLNKKGFYVYLGGELLPYIGMLAGGKQAVSMMGSMGGGMMQGLMILGLILMIIFDAAFIIMYGMNLKHMK